MDSTRSTDQNFDNILMQIVWLKRRNVDFIFDKNFDTQVIRFLFGIYSEEKNNCNFFKSWTFQSRVRIFGDNMIIKND